jgi:hypothetical protein
VCVDVLARCVFVPSFFLSVPASLFIVSKERVRVTFVVKKMKWEKDEREKQKRWSRVRPSSSLSGGSSFPCGAEMQQTLIFWPLHPLVQHVVAMLRFVRVCAVEDGRDGRYGPSDSHREGIMWYSYRYLRRCRGMDVVVVE